MPNSPRVYRRVPESLSVFYSGVPISLDYLAWGCQKPGKPNYPWHQGCSVPSIARRLRKVLRPSKYRRFHWPMNLTYLEHGNNYKNCKQQNSDGFCSLIQWLGVQIVRQQQQSQTQNTTEAAHSYRHAICPTEHERHNSILAPAKYHAHLTQITDCNIHFLYMFRKLFLSF